jgi:hypothetical protein
MEESIVKKLTFERAVLIVFILIILISTSDITSKYIFRAIKKNPVPIDTTGSGRNYGFPSMLMNADNLYKVGNYEEAAKEYLTMTLNSTLSMEQKIHANFRLGVSQYNLKNYDLAFNSFIKATTLSPNDSVAYNNAAVSAYKAMDMEKAIEFQKKALGILPAVEYYYNLARMYEDNEEYVLAANNYLVVAKGEQNITQIERIDPVRIKEKVARLLPKHQDSISESLNNVFIALKIKDNRDIFTLNENEMQLKQGEFIVKVENKKSVKSIVAEYDKEKYDPYGLITELVWTVYKDGKSIYKKTSDRISVDAIDGGNYELKLNIKYNGNKEMVSSKIVRIQESQSTIGNATQGDVVVKPPISNDKKTYIFSIYEQLFESDFKISNAGYTDKYGVLWGLDSGVQTSFNKKLAVDKSTSLIVKNTADIDSGLWVNLDSLLKDENIKGKTVRINFFAREITEDADLFVNIRVKSNNMTKITKDVFSLPFKFEQQSIGVFIPEDATGFTMSIKTDHGEEFNIDGFTVVD